MKRTNTPKLDAKIQWLTQELGPEVVSEIHRAYKATAAAIYRVAKKNAEAKLKEEMQSALADQYRD